MSADKLPEGFSLKINAPKQSLNDFIFSTVHNPVFPFVYLKLKPDSNQENNYFEVKIHPKIYEFIKATSLTDDLVFFLPSVGQIGIWTYDMVVSMKILAELGIISDLKKWILSSRNSLTNLLSNEKVESKKSNNDALKIAEELLTFLNIINEVKENSLLSSVVKDAIQSREMDSDTIIYRLAMAIFHSNRFNDPSVIKALNDPSGLYLKLSQGEIYKKYEKALSLLMDLPVDGRIPAVKVLVTFIIASYLYYSETTGDK